MNEHLINLDDYVIATENGETIGELPENVETFCPDASPAPPTFEPVEVEIELHAEHAKDLWEKIDRKRSDVYKDFYQAYLDGKVSIIDLCRVADALGFFENC